MTKCCERMAKEIGHIIERSSDGDLCVRGCCGGHCYVLTDIKFCPWCGTPDDDTVRRTAAKND